MKGPLSRVLHLLLFYILLSNTVVIKLHKLMNELGYLLTFLACYVTNLKTQPKNVPNTYNFSVLQIRKLYKLIMTSDAQDQVERGSAVLLHLEYSLSKHQTKRIP